MALPKKQVPKDPPEVIAFRMRQVPGDQTIVLAKNSAGAVVKMLSNATFKWEDGVERPYAPWDGAIPSEIEKGLKDGVADSFVFHWVNKDPLQMARQQGLPQWQQVKKADNEVYCPYAAGDNTDGLVHFVDTILHKRPREVDIEFKKQKACILDVDRILDERADAGQEALEEVMSKTGKRGQKVKFTQSFEPVPEQAVTLSQPDMGE